MTRYTDTPRLFRPLCTQGKSRDTGIYVSPGRVGASFLLSEHWVNTNKLTRRNLSRVCRWYRNGSPLIILWYFIVLLLDCFRSDRRLADSVGPKAWLKTILPRCRASTAGSICPHAADPRARDNC